MPQDSYDKIMMMAKRRGFLYPSFEIYGGSAGFYDYGPLGSRLKQNIEDLWRKYYLLYDSCMEINTPTITLFEVLKASGHVDEFTDLTVDCTKCNTSFKVEDIINDTITVEEAVEKGEVFCPNCKQALSDAHPVNLMFSTTIGIGRTRDAFLRPETAQGMFISFHLLYRYAREKLPFGVIQLGKGYRNEVSPRQGPLRMREFSMAEAEIFFDPEHKNHEQFDQVKENELHVFDNVKEMRVTLDEAVKTSVINNPALAYYMYLTQSFLFEAGVDPEKFRFRKHAEDELAHYAKECWDAELYSDRFGWIECVGIADRSAYDLNAHIKATQTDMYALRRFDTPKTLRKKKIEPHMGKLGPLFKQKAGIIKEKLEEIDKPVEEEIVLDIENEKITIPHECYSIVEKEETLAGEKFIPHVIEPSFGIDRILYCILEHNYLEVVKNEEQYRSLTFNPSIAPIKVGVFPLINDEKLVDLSKRINRILRRNGILTSFDIGGTIGRRYARMDEIGTPFCITVDHQSIDDETVTIRYRDTTDQERIPISDLTTILSEKLK